MIITSNFQVHIVFLVMRSFLCAKQVLSPLTFFHTHLSETGGGGGARPLYPGLGPPRAHLAGLRGELHVIKSDFSDMPLGSCFPVCAMPASQALHPVGVVTW